jgi:hypothetical protein
MHLGWRGGGKGEKKAAEGKMTTRTNTLLSIDWM